MPAFERETATGPQHPVCSDEHTMPARIVDKYLSHVSRHDDEIGLPDVDVCGIAFDPLHAFARMSTTRDVEHRP